MDSLPIKQVVQEPTELAVRIDVVTVLGDVDLLLPDRLRPFDLDAPVVIAPPGHDGKYMHLRGVTLPRVE